METVQLQCGSCRKLMAIRAEHLGGQVQCPHCRSVVQTPARSMPEEPAPAAPTPPDGAYTAPTFLDAAINADSPTPEDEPAPTPAPEVDPAAELPKFKPRPIHDKSLLPLMALIFLVPYAIFTTGFLIYVIFYGSTKPADPFEYLRDPAPHPGKGGPKRTVWQPKHDLPLAAHLRTTIGNPIPAGDLVITPSHIRLTKDGDLQLVLRAKNISKDTVFEPMHETFVRFSAAKVDEKPFTFLESKAAGIEKKANLYGAYLGYHKDKDAKDEPKGDAVLRPGEEVTISLTTYAEMRDPHVANIQKSSEEYLWRVHVRRGFVKVDRKDVSATMVIGVDFASKDIERQ